MTILAMTALAIALAAGLGALAWRWIAGPVGAPVRRVAPALLAVSFLLGLAAIAVLPPWEGFDEIAHWSSVQQMADLGRAPVYGRDTLSADRLNWFGPEPRGIDQRGRSYQTLRLHPPISTAGGPDRYRPDRVANWEAQHPPLFYALMAPVYRAAHGLPWVDHLFVLRLTSWLIAWLGLVMGAAANQRALSQAALAGAGGPWSGTIALIWPLVFAGFFADLARLGNDSLCLLLFGGLWAALLPLLDREGAPGREAWLRAAAIAVLLALGLWTKAFFVLISVGLAGLMVARAVRDRSTVAALQAALALIPAWLVGAIWYLARWRATGVFNGTDESIQLAHSGGLLHGLTLHFSLGELLRGLAAMVATVGWVGTWSLTRLAEAGMAPSVLLLGGIAIGYALSLRRAPLASWAPLAMATPMAAGLAYHVLQRLAIDGRGAGTPAWYLHIIAPALGMMMALGWRWPRLFAALAGLGIAYTLASWAAGLSMFSGCTAPDAQNHYDFAHAACAVDWTALSHLGHPALAAAAFVTALALAAYAAVAARPRGSEAVPLEALG